MNHARLEISFIDFILRVPYAFRRSVSTFRSANLPPRKDVQ